MNQLLRRIAALAVVFCSVMFSVDANAAAAVAASTGTLSIAAPTYGVVQNVGVRLITVTRTGGSSGKASVACGTADGTALAYHQYTAIRQTLTWAAGDTTPKTCSVPIIAANPFSGSKNFSVKISEAEGAKIGSPSVTEVTIYGNLGGGAVSLSAASYTALQSKGSVTVSVEREKGAKGAGLVFYSTGGGTAVVGKNYTSKTGMLTWENGDSAPKTFTIPISDAVPFSGNKTLVVTMERPENVVLGATKSAVIVIIGSAPGSAILSWKKPTTNANGTPLTNLAGYKIYYGQSATDLNRVLKIASPSTVEVEISDLPPGQWYFAVASYNTENVESEKSAMTWAPL